MTINTDNSINKINKIRSIIRSLIVFFIIAAIFSYAHVKSVENYRDEIKSCYEKLEPFLNLQAVAMNANNIDKYNVTQVNLTEYLVR